MAELYLAGGCFWGMEKYLASIRGVSSTQVGYANGKTEGPTYEEVCRNDTGHAETVRVTYDPEKLPLELLLELYYDAIDPTSVNRQGNDRGEQYRTGIYYTDEAGLPAIRRSLEHLRNRLPRPVAVELKPLLNFTPAEEYHQKYLDKNPGGYCHIRPDKFKKAAAAVVNPADYPAPDLNSLHTALTRSSSRSPRTPPPSRPSATSFSKNSGRASMWTSPPASRCFPRGTSSNRAAAGPASPSPWTPAWCGREPTAPTAWRAPR